MKKSKKTNCIVTSKVQEYAPAHIDINRLDHFGHIPLTSLPESKIDDILQNIVG